MCTRGGFELHLRWATGGHIEHLSVLSRAGSVLRIKLPTTSSSSSSSSSLSSSLDHGKGLKLLESVFVTAAAFLASWVAGASSSSSSSSSNNSGCRIGAPSRAAVAATTTSHTDSNSPVGVTITCDGETVSFTRPIGELRSVVDIPTSGGKTYFVIFAY